MSLRQEWPATITAREIGAHVAQFMREQGKRAVNASGTCMYRTDDGCACAAGCLLTDAEAMKCSEASAWSRENIDNGEIVVPERLKPFQREVALLQRAHDQSSDVSTVIALADCMAAGENILEAGATTVLEGVK